jgi:hypothetical protein
VTAPAYTRLPTDERRAQLLELAERLFTTHTYGEHLELLGTLVGALEAAGVQPPQ